LFDKDGGLSKNQDSVYKENKNVVPTVVFEDEDNLDEEVSIRSIGQQSKSIKSGFNVYQSMTSFKDKLFNNVNINQ
jgi:hypothetical protein